RQWHEREPDFRAGEILRRNRADLRADGGPGVHNERDQNVDVAFDRMAEGSVAGGDNDLKQVGADREMGRNPNPVNHRRHPDVAGAAAQKSAEQAADERDQENDPKRNRYARNGQPDQWWNIPPLNASGDMGER